MSDADGEAWADIAIVGKGVPKVRGSFATLEVTLSGSPPAEWAEHCVEAIESDPATAELARSPGPTVDGEAVTWVVSDADLAAAWAIVKNAVEAANESYGNLLAQRDAEEARLQGYLDAREDRRAELEKQVKAFK